MPAPARRVPRVVQVEWDPDDIQVADDLAMRLGPDLVDEPVHRQRDARELVAQPCAVERRWHRLEFSLADADDARHVADGAVIDGAVHRRDELVVGVLDVLVVLAVFVADVVLVIQEGDHQGVLEPEPRRVPAADGQVIAGEQEVTHDRPRA